MIDKTILFLAHTGCGDSPLKKYEKELDAQVGWDVHMRLGEPLKKVFSRVISYDFGINHAQKGIVQTNDEIIELVRLEHPKYVMWPSRSYEILESTFQKIRKEGTYIVGWFFDDECRFNEYSRWWIPYLDYVLTTDIAALPKYQRLGAKAVYLLVTSNPEVFKKIEVEKKIDVSFVGTKIADRAEWITGLKRNNVQIHTFGRGWNEGYVPIDEMVKIYNSSKINLCFVKSYGINTRPQMKNKIFDICMCGGFLLCEYIPCIDEHFEIDKEIVCFKNFEEAIDKIRYYLEHDKERTAIARAGWERARCDHRQSLWLMKVFEHIERDITSGNRKKPQTPELVLIPRRFHWLPVLYHIHWARALLLEGFDRKRWKEELDVALFYLPEIFGPWLPQLADYLPRSFFHFLIRLWNALKKIKRFFKEKKAKTSFISRNSVPCPSFYRHRCNFSDNTSSAASYMGWEYAHSGDYHRNLDPNWSYTPTYLKKMKYVFEFISNLGNDVAILDAGCGEGVLVERYQSLGYNIKGIDLNYESSYVKRGNILDMPYYEDCRFDAVLLLDVFEHLNFSDQLVALKEIYRVLRPEGLMLASIPNQAHLNSRFQFVLSGIIDRTDTEINHIGERPFKENFQLLNAAGFGIEKIVGITMTMPFVYRRVICRWPAMFRWLHDLLDIMAYPPLSMLNLFWCRKPE